jgi:hypothetical protein
MIQQDDFTRVNNDTNGNPRYVCHFLRLNIEQDNGQDISEKYITALARSRQFGGRKFHNKQYGGGIVFQSYNLRALCEEINAKLESEVLA